MHEGFVLQQLLLVQFAEQGTGTQPDAAASGDRLGGQGRVQDDFDPAGTEEAVKLRLHPGGEILGRDVGFARRNLVTPEQGVGGCEEETGRVEHGQFLLGVEKVRAAVQRRGIPGKCGRADGPQHAPGSGVATRCCGQEVPGRVPLIALPDKSLQCGNVGAVVAWLQRHLGQLRLAGAPLPQEVLFDAVRPGQCLEHAYLASQPWQCGIEFGQRGSTHGGVLEKPALIATA
ncbi:hypothetical protein D3C72_1552260 [compost metagenome]